MQNNYYGISCLLSCDKNSGASWDLTAQVRSAGVPRGPAAVGAVARLLYGAVLRSLPASARTWFGDLRDRGTAAAVEAYTAAAESPALLAAEIANIQVCMGARMVQEIGAGSWI